MARSSTSFSSKLTDEQVLQAAERTRAGEKKAAIAADLNVVPRTLSRAFKKLDSILLNPDPPEPPRPPKRRPRARPDGPQQPAKGEGGRSPQVASRQGATESEGRLGDGLLDPTYGPDGQLYATMGGRRMVRTASYELGRELPHQRQPWDDHNGRFTQGALLAMAVKRGGIS